MKIRLVELETSLTQNTCTLILCDMNITLSVDEQVVTEARKIASARGTSLNQIIRDYLNQLTERDDPQRTIDELDSLWSESAFRSSGNWTRNELHGRS